MSILHLLKCSAQSTSAPLRRREKFLSAGRPDGRRASILRNPIPDARRREWLHVDIKGIRHAGQVGVIRQPTAVGRKGGAALNKLGFIRECLRLAVISRQSPDRLTSVSDN